MTEILYFKSQDCTPCTRFLPTAKSVAEQLGVNLVVVDVNEYKLKAMKYRVNSLPTMIIEKDGIIKDSLVGAMSRFSMEKKIKNIMNRG